MGDEQACAGITVLLVSWRSTSFLRDLVPNLRETAGHPERLHFRIVDNTGGEDPDLRDACRELDLEPPIPCHPHETNGSRAHAKGLRAAFEGVDTPWVLVADPDIRILLSRWDDELTSAMQSQGLDAVGAAYPAWKLGKYHGFPSPIFCLARTQAVRHWGADWTPFPRSVLARAYGWMGRQIVRMGVLNTRARCISHPSLLRMGQALERLMGVVAPDTGYLLAKAASAQRAPVELFSDIYPTHPRFRAVPDDTLQELAEKFELYEWRSQPILSHMGGTRHYMYLTPKGYDPEYWKLCLQKLNPEEPQ